MQFLLYFFLSPRLSFSSIICEHCKNFVINFGNAIGFCRKTVNRINFFRQLRTIICIIKFALPILFFPFYFLTNLLLTYYNFYLSFVLLLFFFCYHLKNPFMFMSCRSRLLDMERAHCLLNFMD